MMTRLMIWFIELQNRFNELRLFKILTIYVLNWVDDLTSWHLSTLMLLFIALSLFARMLMMQNIQTLSLS